MFRFFSHAGHSHGTELAGGISDLDHCMPIIIGAGIIIVLLAGIIIYMLTTWQPRNRSASAEKVKKPSKNS